jgi:peptide-methionine (R)-S-oxide reductase
MFVEENRSGRRPGGIARRSFLFGAVFAGAALAWRYFPRGNSASANASASGGSPSLPATVEIVDFTDAGVRKGAASVATVIKTEADWRKQLSPDSFEITRHADTERPYTNENPNNHAAGIFRCICCDTLSLTPARNLILAPVGQVFGSPSQKKILWRPLITASAFRGPRFLAAAAMRT